MNIKPIRSDADYQLALKRLEEVFDAPVGSSEGDEADVLALLVDEYEKNAIPLMLLTPLKLSR